MAEHQGLEIARWAVQSKDSLASLAFPAKTLAAAIVAFFGLRMARRDSERARLKSRVGKVQTAMQGQGLMHPFVPTPQQVIHRNIFKTIKHRIAAWNQHHRPLWLGHVRGAGTSFARRVKGADWENQMYKRLGLAGPDMLEEVLRRVRVQLGKLEGLSKAPIIVLDIPRKTT